MKERNKRIMKKYVFPSIEAFLIVILVMAFVYPVSCKLTENGIEIRDCDYSSPVIEDYSLTGKDSLRMCFSRAVELDIEKIDPPLAVKEIRYEKSSEDDASVCFVDIEFSDEMLTGENYQLLGTVHDSWHNSLMFSIPFKGLNNTVPELEIREIHPDGRVYKEVLYHEYIVLYAKTGGNLSGVQILSANDGEKLSFVLPACEVRAGELITCHMRKGGGAAVSEVGEDLTVSGGVYSSENRDLWCVSNESNGVFGATTDVIVLKNTQDDSILDCIMYSKNIDENSSWTKNEYKKMADLAFSYDKWAPDASVQAAVDVKGMSYNYVLVKNGKENEKDSWELKLRKVGI